MVPFIILPPMPLDGFGDWKPIVQIRDRYEHRVNFDFDKGLADVTASLHNRVRLGFEGELPDEWKVRVVYQHSYSHDWTPAGNFRFEKNNIREAFFSHADDQGERFRLGRQPIKVDNQRLVGPNDWDNIGRTFDAVRWKSGGRGAGWDFFLGKLGIAPNGEYSKNAMLGGIGVRNEQRDHVYLFYKQDRQFGLSTNVYTLNFVDRGTHRQFDHTLELSAQAGTTPGGDLQAWHGSANVGMWFSPNLRGYVETNWASGGGGGTHTFDNLYPTNHDKYGYADLQGLRNVRHYAAGLEWDPPGPFEFDTSCHTFRLYDMRDAWYGAGGQAKFIDPSGASGRNVGSEWDIRGRFNGGDDWYLDAGFSLFMPGSFVNSVQGGNVGNLTFGYLTGGWYFKS